MTVLELEATIRWIAGPPKGVPRLTVGSGTLHSLPLNVAHEAKHPLATSPGELLAGAIGSTFAWLAAEEFVREGTHARELVANVTLTVSNDATDSTNLALSGIACQLEARVPSVNQERLDAVAKAAMSRCLKALGLRTDAVAVTVMASLEGA